MMPGMHLLIASGILGLGESPSAFGQTLALVLTFFIVIGGLVNFLVAFIVGQVVVERRQNIERAREYDQRQKS